MGGFSYNPENNQKRIESKRHNKSLKDKLNIPRPVKAIRLKCLDCAAGSPAEVYRCHIEGCP